MDKLETQEPSQDGAQAPADVARLAPLWDQNLIWDEGGWPIGCIGEAEAPTPNQ